MMVVDLQVIKGPAGGDSNTAPKAAPATCYAGGSGLLDRAQPVLADLQPEEEALRRGLE